MHHHNYNPQIIFELDDDGYAPDSLGAILQRQKEQNDLVAEVKAQYGDNYALPYLPIKSGTSVSMHFRRGD